MCEDVIEFFILFERLYAQFQLWSQGIGLDLDEQQYALFAHLKSLDTCGN